MAAFLLTSGIDVGLHGSEWAMVGLTGIGVFITAVYVFVAWRTLKAIKRQADLAQRQAAQMEEQTKKLGESISIARDAGKAAQESAAATSRNIEITIQRERARIFVEVLPLSLSKTSLKTHVVDYRVIFHGQTFAFIEDTAAEASYGDSADPPGRRPFGGIYGISTFIPPGTEPHKSVSLFLHEFDDFEIESIRHKKLFLHFWGWIKYKDFTGTDRETSFCYSWKVRPLPPAIGWERWEKSGPPEANRET